MPQRLLTRRATIASASAASAPATDNERADIDESEREIAETRLALVEQRKTLVADVRSATMLLALTENEVARELGIERMLFSRWVNLEYPVDFTRAMALHECVDGASIDLLNDKLAEWCKRRAGRVQEAAAERERKTEAEARRLQEAAAAAVRAAAAEGLTLYQIPPYKGRRAGFVLDGVKVYALVYPRDGHYVCGASAMEAKRAGCVLYETAEEAALAVARDPTLSALALSLWESAEKAKAQAAKLAVDSV